MKNLEIIFNTISQQSKGLTSKITPNEWNFIVNALSKQSNHNAEVLKNLKILLGKIIESGEIKQEEIDQLKLDIQTIKEIDYINIQNQDTSEVQKLRLYVVGGQIGYEIEGE